MESPTNTGFIPWPAYISISRRWLTPRLSTNRTVYSNGWVNKLIESIKSSWISYFHICRSYWWKHGTHVGSQFDQCLGDLTAVLSLRFSYQKTQHHSSPPYSKKIWINPVKSRFKSFLKSFFFCNLRRNVFFFLFKIYLRFDFTWFDFKRR